MAVQTHGEVDAEGLISFTRDLIQHPDWRPGMKVLADHRQSNFSLLNPARRALTEYVDWLRSHADQFVGVRCATLVGSLLGFGAARLWESITVLRGFTIEHRVFHSEPKAMDWLLRA